MTRAGEHEELQYLNLIKQIIANGQERQDRTGTGTKSLFAPPQLRFSLANDTLPLLTTKRVFYRGVVEELLWFLRGETNAQTLRDKGVGIWDGNASREFLDSRGLHENPAGDLGPVYGFQWRHFGAEYKGLEHDYTGQGVDQLRTVIGKILRTPADRRLLISAWNPRDLDRMALPPCHLMCQFYVNMSPESGKPESLSCQMYQRSCDVGLGVPFNIASYAILTRIIAHACGLRACEFVHVMGDSHVYNNHVDALLVQCQRTPTDFPTMIISKKFPALPASADSITDALIDEIVCAIEELTVDDFQLHDYKPQGKIAMTMAV